MTVKKPQDRLPGKGEKFTYTADDGTVISVPSLNSLMTFGFSRTHRHLSPDEQVYVVLEDNLDKDTLALVDALDRTETKAFVEGWQEHSGIEVGESSAS